MFTELVYTRQGSGEPLVLFHGIGHRRQAWDPIFSQLAERYDVIAVDLSGFGESPAFPLSEAYTMKNAVRNIDANFARWGITRPHVVGNSLGGAIALELGARGLVSSVTALSPAGFFGPFNRYIAIVQLVMLRALTLLTPASALRSFSKNPTMRRIIGWALYAHPERFDADATFGDALALKRSKAFERTAVSAITYTFKSQVPVPTTIGWGVKDRILPFAQSKVARERLPFARHVAIPDAGHVPMIDDPELVIDLIDTTVASSHSRTR